jgi:steroid 5-alpha reductase family enzyme
MFLSTFVIAGLLILGMMVALWLLSLVLKDSSIVDIFWGTGFTITAWAYFALTPEGFATRKLLAVVLVTVWGLRLSLHILMRNRGHGEDFRYQAWRGEAGRKWWWFSFFKVFLLQGVLMWVISAPLLGAMISPMPNRITIVDALGCLLWSVGFFFEAVGDWQLARFKANPANKGKLLTSGVWRYTRHPNYFGDAAQWWGFYLLAVTSLPGALTIFSPILMTFLLVKVSGVAMLEKSLKSAKTDYDEYAAHTNAFIPWLPKSPRMNTDRPR